MRRRVQLGAELVGRQRVVRRLEPVVLVRVGLAGLGVQRRREGRGPEAGPDRDGRRDRVGQVDVAGALERLVVDLPEAGRRGRRRRRCDGEERGGQGRHGEGPAHGSSNVWGASRGPITRAAPDQRRAIEGRHAHRRPRLPRRRSGQGRRARRRERRAAIQIFNQNPRAWKPTVYSDEQVAAFREAMADQPRRRAAHPRRLPAQRRPREDRRSATRRCASLIASLRAGDALGAHAVVLHPGSAKAGEVGAGDRARRARSSREALAESERCPLHLENTAGAGGTLGRSFQELAALLRRGGRRRAPGAVPGLLPPVRLGLRHPHRGGADRRARRVRREGRAGRASARCTSTTRRRRWAPTATATPTSARASSARRAAPSSSPSRASTELPCVLETPGPERTGPSKQEITLTRRLRQSRHASAKLAPTPCGYTGSPQDSSPPVPCGGVAPPSRAQTKQRRPPAPGPAVERGVARATVADRPPRGVDLCSCIGQRPVRRLRRGHGRTAHRRARRRLAAVGSDWSAAGPRIAVELGAQRRRRVDAVVRPEAQRPRARRGVDVEHDLATRRRGCRGRA